jgi:hypothetical protein
MNLLLLITSIAFDQSLGIDRSRLAMDLSSLDDHPDLLASLLETIDTAGHTTTSKSSRRRQKMDMDCDSVVAYPDNIEDTCNNHRQEILFSLGPNFTNVVQVNSTLGTRVQNLETVVNGDPDRPSEMAGIVKTMYLQRIALYGGVDPSNKASGPGLIKDMKTAVNNELRLQQMAEQSLDSLWLAAQQTDKNVGYILYNQVFRYGKTVDDLMKMMGKTGGEVLDHDIAEIQAATNRTNAVMTELSKQICQMQQELGEQGKLTTKEADESMNQIARAVEQLFTKSDDFLNLLDEKRIEADQVIDSVSEGSEMIMSTGVDAINMLSDSFLTNFSENLARMIEVFDKSSESEILREKERLSAAIGNGTNQLMQAVEGRRESLNAKREQVGEQINNLKTALLDKVARVRAWQASNFTQAEEMLAARKDDATRSLSTVQETQRAIAMKIEDASRQVDPLTAGFRSDLAKEVNKLGSASGRALEDAVANIEKAITQILSASAGSELAISEQLHETSGGMGESSVSANMMANDQAGLISSARAVGKAEIRSVEDIANAAIRAGIGALLSSVGGTASDTLRIAHEMNLAGSSANADSKNAINSLENANEAELRAAHVSGILSVSNSTKLLASFMASATGDFEDSKKGLSGAENQLVSADTSLGTIFTQGAAIDEKARATISSIQSRIAGMNDGLADAIDDTLKMGLKNVGLKVDEQTEESALQLNSETARVAEKLGSLIAELKNDDFFGGSLDPSEQKQMIKTLEEIQRGMADLEAKQEKAVDGFNSSLSTWSQKFRSNLPSSIQDHTEMLRSMRANLGKNIKQIVTGNENAVGSKMKALAEVWDAALAPGIAKQLTVMDSALHRLFEKAAAVSSHGMNATSDLVEAVSALEEKLESEKKKKTNDLLDFEYSLGRLVNETSDNFLKNFTAAPEDIAAAFEEATRSVMESLTGAAEVAIKLKGDASEIELTNGLASESDTDTKELSDIDTVLMNVTSDLQAMSELQKRRIETGRTEVLTAEQYVRRAGELARKISESVAQFEYDGKRKLDKVVEQAYEMNAKIDRAVGWEDKIIEKDMAHRTAALGFQTKTDGVAAIQMAEESASSVESALSTVKSFQDALDRLTKATGVDAEATRALVAGTGSEIEQLFTSMDFSANRQSDILNSSLRLEQKINQLQFARIRDFTNSVRYAWLRYVESQDEKFSKLSYADKVNFAHMKTIADTGLTDGDDKIMAANRSVGVVQDSANTALLNFTGFETEFADESNFASEQLSDFVANVTFDNSTIITILNASRAGMETADSGERLAIGAKLTDFEAALDDISNKVLQSVT